MSDAYMAELVLNPLHLENLARQWLLEDASNFDYGGAVAGDEISVFDIIFKSADSMLAGIPFADAIFAQLGVKPVWFFKDGDYLAEKDIIGRVTGPAKHLLLAERVVLNVLCRASGVASIAYEMKTLLNKNKWAGCLAGTRKTTPGFRLVEKYALIVGGVDTHRYDLSSMVMLKDNHIAISGSIKEAVSKARSLCSFSQKIEVECNTLEQAVEAAKAGCDIIMLDNFKPEDLHVTAETVKKTHPNILVEASGGVTADNVLLYASPWIDIISSSSLIQGYRTVDISMKVTG